MEKFTANFILVKETKGALRYEQVDDAGKKVEIEDGASIGTLYVRKSAFPAGHTPERLAIEVLAQ